MSNRSQKPREAQVEHHQEPSQPAVEMPSHKKHTIELAELVGIPSVSADPAYETDLQTAAGVALDAKQSDDHQDGSINRRCDRRRHLPAKFLRFQHESAEQTDDQRLSP